MSNFYLANEQVKEVIGSTLTDNALKEKTVNRIIARYHDYSVLGSDLISPFKSFRDLGRFVDVEIKELNAAIRNSCSQEQRDYLLARYHRLLSLGIYLSSNQERK